MATVATVNELGSYSHNPRGNLWLNDESSFGKKLLLKMGWRKGKGLGKKEDGIKENLKVKFKDTNSGLGYKDDSYTNVMKTEYESILKSLRAQYPQQKSVNDCNKNVGHENQDFKQKSRIAKNRIRYPKLYYGKDVSRYSDKDMKSIFICSLPIKDNEEEESKDSGLCMKKESENHLSKPQETYTSHLSISDYFNMKMKEKKDNEQKRKYNNVKQEETDSCCNKINYEIEETESGFQSDKLCKVKEEKSNPEYSKTDCKLVQEKNDYQFCMTEDIVSNPSGKRHKRKRKNSKMYINDEDDKNLLFLMEKEKKDAINPNKKQKKSAEDSVYEGTVCEEKTQKSNLMPGQSSISRKKRKSHKIESFNSAADTVESLSDQSNIHTDIMPVIKRKKSHRSNNISTSAIELHSVTSLKDVVSTNSELVNNLPSLAEVMVESLTVDNNSPRKKQKKLKNKFKKLKSCLKSKKGEYVVKNVSFNENVSYQFIDSGNESTGSLSDCQYKIQRDFELSASDDNLEQEKDSDDIKTEMEGCNLKEHNETNCSNVSETVSEEKTEMCDSLSSLPSSNSSYYNSWVESQQQALKMTLYKDLLNGIKKHDILKTTNMLFIKGYGNWGF